MHGNEEGVSVAPGAVAVSRRTSLRVGLSCTRWSATGGGKRVRKRGAATAQLQAGEAEGKFEKEREEAPSKGSQERRRHRRCAFGLGERSGREGPREGYARGRG
jgi:hypothetical protein